MKEKSMFNLNAFHVLAELVNLVNQPLIFLLRSFLHATTLG